MWTKCYDEMTDHACRLKATRYGTQYVNQVVRLGQTDGNMVREHYEYWHVLMHVIRVHMHKLTFTCAHTCAQTQASLQSALCDTHIHLHAHAHTYTHMHVHILKISNYISSFTIEEGGPQDPLAGSTLEYRNITILYVYSSINNF